MRINYTFLGALSALLLTAPAPSKMPRRLRSRLRAKCSRLRKQAFRRVEHKYFHDSGQALGNKRRNGRPEKAVGISEDVFGMSEKSPGPRVAWRRGAGRDPEPEKILAQKCLRVGPKWPLGTDKIEVENDIGGAVNLSSSSKWSKSEKISCEYFKRCLRVIQRLPGCVKRPWEARNYLGEIWKSPEPKNIWGLKGPSYTQKHILETMQGLWNWPNEIFERSGMVLIAIFF